MGGCGEQGGKRQDEPGRQVPSREGATPGRAGRARTLCGIEVRKGSRPRGAAGGQAAMAGGAAPEAPSWPRLGSARLGSARLGSARLGSARLGSARLGSARLARLGSARLGSARLGSARLGSARLGSALKMKTAFRGCQALFDGGGAGPAEHAAEAPCLHGPLLFTCKAVGGFDLARRRTSCRHTTCRADPVRHTVLLRL